MKSKMAIELAYESAKDMKYKVEQELLEYASKEDTPANRAYKEKLRVDFAIYTGQVSAFEYVLK